MMNGLGRLLRKDDSRSNMTFKIARNMLTQHQRSDASSNSRCFVSAIPLHEEEAVTHCHPMNCVVLPDLTSVFAPFRNLEIEWRQGKKTLSRDEPTNSRPNSKQPAKARQGLVWFSNGCHLNSSTDNLPCRVVSLVLRPHVGCRFISCRRRIKLFPEKATSPLFG